VSGYCNFMNINIIRQLFAFYCFLSSDIYRSVTIKNRTYVHMKFFILVVMTWATSSRSCDSSLLTRSVYFCLPDLLQFAAVQRIVIAEWTRNKFWKNLVRLLFLQHSCTDFIPVHSYVFRQSCTNMMSFKMSLILIQHDPKRTDILIIIS
jgi:hypothetical protein